MFIPTEIAWGVERSFSWISRYRRLNTIVERTKEHLVAFVEIAFVSILSRRLKRLVTQAAPADVHEQPLNLARLPVPPRAHPHPPLDRRGRPYRLLRRRPQA